MQISHNITNRYTAFKAQDETYLNYIPMIIGLGFIIFTFIIFLLSPFSWPIYDYTKLVFYMSAVVFFIFIGFYIGCKPQPSYSTPLKVEKWILLGTFLSVILLFPSSYVYAGKWPWQFFAALSDQNDAYKSLSDQLTGESITRAPIIAARVLSGPVIFAVLPLSVLYWQKLNFKIKICTFVVIFCNIIFSVLRGTTREIVDIAIVIFASIAITTCRNIISNKTPAKIIIYYFSRILLITLILFSLTLTVLTIRSESRLGVQAQFCIGYSNICADNGSPINKLIPDSAFFTFSNATAYLSQGYYGLALALDRDFESAGGLGHSPALKTLAGFFIDSDDIYSKSYTYKNYIDNWSDEYQWSTMATWIANDIGFPATLIFFLILGILLSISWRSAIYRDNDKAALSSIIILFMLFYFPANNQMMSTLDGYFNTIFWLVYFFSGNRR